MKHYAITAWTLMDGLSVWLKIDDGKRVWIPDFAEATIFDDKDAVLNQIGDASADVANRIINDPYEFTVTKGEDNVWQPDGQREQIRALREPTIPWGDDAVQHIFNPQAQEQAA